MCTEGYPQIHDFQFRCVDPFAPSDPLLTWLETDDFVAIWVPSLKMVINS